MCQLRLQVQATLAEDPGPKGLQTSSWATQCLKIYMLIYVYIYIMHIYVMHVKLYISACIA